MQPNAPFTSDPVVREVPSGRDRTARRPQHVWQAAVRPYRLFPTFLAPMMAGDTLKALTYQARAISDPLVSSLAGWHWEHWTFFVRIADMADGQAILAALISEDTAPTISDSADADWYHVYGINWTKRAFEVIVPHYFREYPESGTPSMSPTEGDLPILEVRTNRWFENFTRGGDMPSDDADAEDFENAWSKWTVLSRNRLTTATYEEWLQQQGIRPPANLRQPDWDLRIPELVRHYRDWQFPVSTINPANGTASNAVSWAVQDRADRARRWTEPGFLVGCCCVRPKEYLPVASTDTSIHQAGSASGMLRTAKSWIPPVYVSEPGESLVEFPDTITGALGVDTMAGADADYWLDSRDLWLNGDQMIIGSSAQNVIARRAEPDWRFPTEASITALFSGDTPAGLVRHEGMASLHVLGRVRKTTR